MLPTAGRRGEDVRTNKLPGALSCNIGHAASQARGCSRPDVRHHHPAAAPSRASPQRTTRIPTHPHQPTPNPIHPERGQPAPNCTPRNAARGYRAAGTCGFAGSRRRQRPGSGLPAVQGELSFPAHLHRYSASQTADRSTLRHAILPCGCKPSVGGALAGPAQPTCRQATDDTTPPTMAPGAAADRAAESGPGGGLARRCPAAAHPASSTLSDRSASSSKRSYSSGAARRQRRRHVCRTLAGCLGCARRPGHCAAAVLL